MAITVTQVGTASNGAGQGTLTLSNVTVPAGALVGIIVAENSGSGTAQTISDGGVNTYSQVTGMPSLTNGMTNFWYKENVSALNNATITYSKQNSGRDTTMIVFYATGILTASALDATTSVASAFAATTTPTKTTGTPTQAGELLIAFMGASTTLASMTQDGSNGWTDPTTKFVTTGSAAWCAWAYQVNSGTGTKTYAPTLGSSVAGTIGIAGFKADPNTTIYTNIAMMGM